VRRFLGHWRPDLALWVESELWPNLVLETAARGVPMLLLNARLSPRSYARWRRMPRLIGPLLSCFRNILALTPAEAERFRLLGAANVAVAGNLKYDASPPPGEPAALAALARTVGTRPLWLAASTHAGEEAPVAATHAALKAQQPTLLTILVPRHPERGGDVAALLEGAGLRVARRSRGEPIAPETDIYLADTLGELGLFYRLAPIVFVGGSLVPLGGHNPLEPAQLDCALIAGPHMENFSEIRAALERADALETVTDGETLRHSVAALLARPDEAAHRAAAARAAGAALGGAADAALAEIMPLLDKLAPRADSATDTAADTAHARA
jgi:3-deoxy-D-manno-octulosonic-acid transferase